MSKPKEILRTRPRIGYACMSELTGRTTNHNCRLASATPDRLRALISQNLDDLEFILSHNAAHDWRLFRIGSSFIPFASHPVNTLAWWDEFAPRLTTIGDYARENHLRLSMHPGQYTVLSSPDAQIRAASRAELEYGARLLDAFGLNAQCKLVLHLGGTYGDMPSAVARFVAEARGLPENVRQRLVLENDERSYTMADALAVSDETGLPVVFDNLHHEANPSPGPLDALLTRVWATWRAADGPPKVHFSSQARGERTGKHAEFVSATEFRRWNDLWSRHGPFDIMVEAKGKDAALRKL